MSYDPAAQAASLREALAELREVGRRVAWEGPGVGARARETYNVTCAYMRYIASSLETEGIVQEMTDEECDYFSTGVYGLIEQAQQMAADLRLVLDRVPGLRRAES